LRARQLTTEELLAYPLEDLYLGTRAYNALKRQKFVGRPIETIGDLCGMLEIELAAIPNVGAVTIREIKGALAEVGLSLA